MRTENQRRVLDIAKDAMSEYDFSEWLVPGAQLPASESEYSDLQARFGRMLVGSFEDQHKQESGIALDAWDEYIFDSIQEYGPLVLLSRTVVRRIFAWQFDVNCIPKFHRLGKELARAARIRRRSATGRITAKHVLFSRVVNKELSLLRTKIREAWPENVQDIVACIATELICPDSRYPNLTKNVQSLLNFLVANPEVTIRFRGTLKPSGKRTLGLSDDVGPARFLNLWIAYVENKTEDSVRQQLWSQGRLFRSSQ